MKAWLPILVDNLAENPVLALSSVANLARAAVYDRRGQLLAGGLGSPALAGRAAEAAQSMSPGECRLEPQLSLECLAPDRAAHSFWSSAREIQDGAWAAWLLTMPGSGRDGQLKLTRHFLSAFGPWTTPRLPEEFRDQWSLLPLKAGLGRLFIFGDDDLALETAALAARTGLTVTWLTTAESFGPELDEARSIGDFDSQRLDDWSQLTPDYLRKLGVKDGVRLLITTPGHQDFLEILKSGHPAYLALSGEAENLEGRPGAKPAGLFNSPLTTTQKALGLIAAMLQ